MKTKAPLQLIAKYLFLSSIFLFATSTGWSIDSEKYRLGMDYEEVKKTIFEDGNLVNSFDQSSISAIDKDEGSVFVKFDNGKATEIRISNIVPEAFNVYTTWIKKLTALNATLASGRPPRKDASVLFGAAYLWKLPDSEVEVGLFSKHGLAAVFQLVLKATN